MLSGGNAPQTGKRDRQPVEVRHRILVTAPRDGFSGAARNGGPGIVRSVVPAQSALRPASNHKQQGA